MRRLEYCGRPNPFLDIHGFVEAIRRRNPGITDAGVNYLVKHAVETREPRVPKRTVVLLGADILTADLTSLPAHRWLPDNVISMIEMYPPDTGELIEELDASAQKIVLRGKDPGRVNRLSIVSITGLMASYVWCEANEWLQWVSEHDYDLILAHGRKRFRDPDVHGPHREVRSYEAPAVERQVFTVKDVQEGEPDRFLNERTIKNYVSGAELAG
jgi:hypothetical protein